MSRDARLAGRSFLSSLTCVESEGNAVWCVRAHSIEVEGLPEVKLAANIAMQLAYGNKVSDTWLTVLLRLLGCVLSRRF